MGTSGISSAEAVQFIRGEAGSKVTLTLLRDEDPNPIVKEITRKDISVPSVILTFVGEREDIAHIQLLKFAGETNGEWEKVVSSILKKTQGNFS
jgi:C-terminal processing protease CtpA/Prc